MRYGLTVDPDTLRWWMKQDKEAQAVFNDPNATSLQAALVEFAEEGHVEFVAFVAVVVADQVTSCLGDQVGCLVA